MNAGVWMGPCGVRMIPARPIPSSPPIRAVISKPKPRPSATTCGGYRGRIGVPHRRSVRTKVKRVTNGKQCIQRVYIDEKILPKHLVSACQSLLYSTQRTARCGSVRRPAAYRVRPGNPRVLAGVAARYGSRNATKNRSGGNTRRAPRTAHTADGPGQPGGSIERSMARPLELILRGALLFCTATL